MGKKVFILGFFFLILIGINLLIILRISRTSRKDAQIKKILTDISSSDQFNSLSGPVVLGTFEAQAKLSDNRVANLKSFFRKYNSPLYDHAETIVTYADQYKFDYRLLPAIAMQESNLCKYIPDDSYNCWGWGIYGDTVTRFEGYDEAIETVSRGLKEHYIDHGLVTASSIMEKYTPSSKGSWAYSVNTFLKVLE